MLLSEIVMLAATQNGRAAAAPSAHAAWPSLIGPELMVNGDCGSATGWSLPTGVSIAAGKQVWTAVSIGSVTNAGTPGSALVQGGVYRCNEVYDSISGGSLVLRLAGELGAVRSAAGTYSEDIVASSPDDGGWELAYNLGTVTATLDNFSVKSVGLMGIETDWSFTGAMVWGVTNILVNSAAEGDKAELTGSAKTSFDAAVSNSTACTVTLSTNPAEDTLSGTVTVTLKGGTPVNFVGDGSGADITHTVTSGTGSGFIITAGSGNPSGLITRVQIDLAP